MAWSFDVTANIPRLTQSGTDTGLAGIATAITAVARVARSTAYTTVMLRKPPIDNGMWYRCSTAGTSAATEPIYNSTLGSTTTDGTSVWTAFKAPDVQTLGTTNHYYMPAIRVQITGTLTNANPQQQNFHCLDLFIFAGNFISGAWASDGVTPRWDGVHFATTRTNASGADPSAFFIQNNGQCTFIGGEVQVSGGISFDSGTTPRTYKTRWRNTKEFGASSARFRSYTTNAIFENVEIYDIAFDLFRMPTVPPSIKAIGSEYVYQYVGAAFGGADAKFAASALENPDGTYDFDNFASGWVELYNCAKGANLNVVTQHPSSTFWVKHLVPLYQDLRITAKDTSGAVLENVRFNCTDTPTNSPTVTFTTAGNLKTWDFRNPFSYETTTNASGIALSTPALQAWYWEGSFKKNLRFPLSTATYQGRAYNYKTMNVSVVLGSNSIQDVSAGMVALDTATTITETAASAITGITLTPSGATGGTITISSNHEYKDVWEYYRWWISQFANKTSNDTWTCTGGILNTQNWNIVVNSGVTLSGSSNISTIKTLGTVTNNGSITSTYADSTGVYAKLLVNGLSTNMIAKLITGSTVLSSLVSTGTSGYLDYFIPTGSTSISATLYVERATGQANGYNLYTNTLVLGDTGATTTAIMAIDTFYGRSAGQADRSNVSVTWNSTTGAPTITLSGDADVKSVYDVVLESHATTTNITYNRPTTGDGFTYQFNNAIFTGTGKMTGSKQFFTTGGVSITYDLILNYLNTLNFLSNSWIKVIKSSDDSVLSPFALNTTGKLELNMGTGIDYKVFLKKDGYKPLVVEINSGTGQALTLNQVAQAYYNGATNISTLIPLLDVTNVSGVLAVVSVGEMTATSLEVCAIIDYLQKDEDYADVALFAETGDIWQIDSQYQNTPDPDFVKIERDPALTSSELTIWDTYFTSSSTSYPDTAITPIQTSTGLWVIGNRSAVGEVTIKNEQAVAISENASEYVWSKVLENSKTANKNVSQSNNFDAITSIEVQKTN
jgi:hypothetical protein